jgi:antitoxin YefM
MTIAATPVPLSGAKARLSELARRVRQQHERITLTRNGEPEAVLVSVDDLEGLEMTLEILGDTEAVARISESLAALGRGEPGADLATVRQDLARHRARAIRDPVPARRAAGHRGTTTRNSGRRRAGIL